MRNKIAPISSIASMLLGGIVALISTLSFIVDIIATRNISALALDIVVMSISYLTVWQGIYYTILDRIVKEKNDEDWNNKIKPIINMMAETSGKVDAIEQQMGHMSLKVDNSLNYIINAQDMDATKMFIVPGMSFKFLCKILVMIFFTFSSLVYVSSYPLGIVHYFILAIYVTWWMFITLEFKLFDRLVAWIWVLGPVMTIPTVGIIVSTIYGLNIMIGIFFLVMLIYVYSYYSWSSYITTGYKPFEIKPIAYMIKNKLFGKSDLQKIKN
jgi:hypothetical protein